MAPNLYICLKRVGILKMLSFSILEHDMSFVIYLELNFFSAILCDFWDTSLEFLLVNLFLGVLFLLILFNIIIIY